MDASNGKNYFELFEVEESFIVDIDHVREVFEQKQNSLSENLMTHKDPQKMQEAMAHAVYLNEAYNTLTNPHLRALYLVKLEGHDISKEKATVTPGFRMSSMNIMSALEEAQTSDSPYGALRDVLKRVSVSMESICRDLELMLDSIDDINDWDPLISNLNELDFYLKVQGKSQQLLYQFLRDSKKKK